MVIWLWIGFLALVGALVALDLRVARRHPRDVSPAAAIGWTAIWVACSLAVGGLIFLLYDAQWAGLGQKHTDLVGNPLPITGEGAFVRFITAYLLEAALSLDNLFVIALILGYFKLNAARRHLVLFTGLLIAVPLRAVLLGAGVTVLNFAPWTTYLFGAVLLLAAVKMATLHTGNPDPESNPAIRVARRLYPATSYEGRRFLTRLPPRPGRARGRLAVTPLLVALLMVESADAVYALGSIPAVLTITQDPFLVFSSNILAILTVRSMYPALAGVLHRFTYVKAGLVFVLLFVAAKMLLAHQFTIPPEVTLTVVVGILCIGAVASFMAGTPSMRAPFGSEVEFYARLTVRQARRLIILVVGLTLVALSVPLGLLLPGPTGIPFAILGLMILATEFVWAQHLLRRAKQSAGAAAARAERHLGAITKLRRFRMWLAARLGWGDDAPPPDGAADKPH